MSNSPAAESRQSTISRAAASGRYARWGCLMLEARAGDDKAYAILLGELNVWLRCYFARRLPSHAADDARQETLLAVHAHRLTQAPASQFGPWVACVAHNKWVDQLRDANRHSALPPDEEIPIEDHGRAVVSEAALNHLLVLLKPDQANVIRLVKLKGFSIARASAATGQSASLVKINIHRGLKKLAALAS